MGIHLRRFACACAAALIAPASGQVLAVDWRLLLKGGVDTGGGGIKVEDPASGNTVDSVTPDYGFFFGGGASLVNDDRTVQLDVTLSKRTYNGGPSECPSSIPQCNWSYTWSSEPLEALLFYRWRNFLLGGGLSYDLAPRIEGSGFASALSDVHLKSKGGELLQADWRFAGGWPRGAAYRVGARYSWLQYERGDTGARVNSSGVGLVLTAEFLCSKNC